jgi:hypothetical protein
MSLRKYLLIPQLSLYARRAPRDQGQAWEHYWSSVRRTGTDGAAQNHRTRIALPY